MNLNANAVLLIAKTDNLVEQLQRAEAARTRSIILSMLVGSIFGWAIGVGQLLIIGSWDLFMWAWMPLIPFYSALGWALFGMIMSGSGVFSHSKPAGQTVTEKGYPQRDVA